jgi:hypothetical protein
VDTRFDSPHYSRTVARGHECTTAVLPARTQKFVEAGTRQIGSYSAASEHLRHSVEEHTQLSRSICAALSRHLRRSVFAPVHRRLRTKGRSLSLGVQEHQRNCASKSVHLSRIVTSPALDEVTYTPASEHFYINVGH